MKRICLVTSEHISYNPRLAKEADTLTTAGYGVRVVAVNLEPMKWAWDQSLMASRSWKLDVVTVQRKGVGSGRWLRAALRQKIFGHVARFIWTQGCVVRAYSRHGPELARLTAREPADLFIGHLAGLPAAAAAAQRWKAKLGFDAEDFHRGELDNEHADRELRRLTALIEDKYIPRCDYVTAASAGIGRAYADALKIARPETILNVFPLADRKGCTPSEDLAKEREGAELSLYWYSQTIGPDRGLDDALRAMSLLPPRLRLTVRGNWAAGYQETFMREARKLGVADRIRALSPEPPQQLVERASRHDVGLALEAGIGLNNRLALSNKLCVYLLAGLAVAVSDTPGQREIMDRATGAGFLYRIGDAAALADGLRRWVEKPELLRASKEEARRLAETEYCRENESKKFLKIIERVI